MNSREKRDRGRVVAGKYELHEVCGEGGMAVVWRGVMRGAAGFTRPIAVKKMKEEIRAAQNSVAMFVEEARVASELQHPNIVQIYDFCEDTDGMYCLVMEWVDGMDLGAFLRSLAKRNLQVPWPLACAIGVGALRGLGAAHDRIGTDGQPAPVIHRDVSPGNILIGRNGIVKLSDFGLARARDRMMSLTMPGTVKGKLSYLAPEIARGGAASPRSDIYGIGCVLWETLAGRALFNTRTDPDAFRRIHRGEIPQLLDARPDIPLRVADVVHQALTLLPSKRFTSAREMAQELANLLATSETGGDSQARLGQGIAEIRAWSLTEKTAMDAKLPESQIIELSLTDIKAE